MEKLLYLNDLLHLNDTELGNTKIKFNQNNGTADPMVEYTSNPDLVNNAWLFWRSENRFFNIGQNAVCFLKLTYDTWLLTTIKTVTKEIGVKNGINYEGEEIERFQKYFGRVIIKYHKTHQTQVVWAKSLIDNLEVLQILPTIFDGDDFPGYDKVQLPFSQLATIINRSKRDWLAALRNQKAIYLITDISNGKQYVGSAYGDNDMLLQRWSNYVYNGHGGNKELIEIVNDGTRGFEYVKKNFQYSILENYNARVGNEIILGRESWWKDTLGTRKFGYNAN